MSIPREKMQKLTTEELIKKVVALVAAKHNVIIREDDPILLTLITNHEVLQLIIDQVYLQNKSIELSIENFTNKTERLIKDYEMSLQKASEKMLSDTAKVINNSIEKLENTIESSQSKNDQQNTKSWSSWLKK